MSLFGSDPFSTLSAETLFGSELKPQKFKACPPTWEVWLYSIDPNHYLNQNELRGGRTEDGGLAIDEPSLPVSCAGGRQNAINLMVEYLADYVSYGPHDTMRFCEACNGVPEGEDASLYTQLDKLNYKFRASDGSRDDQDDIVSCRSDEPFAKLEWVDYPSAGYMCQATLRDYLRYHIGQQFRQEDYDTLCEGCDVGQVFADIFTEVTTLTGNWWEDYDPDAPVDCETGEWTKWGECVEGRQMRHKKVLRWNRNGGAPCDEERAEERIEGSWAIGDYRNCTPCEISGWSDWSSCVNGKQKRTKKDTYETEDEEYACAVLEEVRDCNTTNLGSGETQEEKAVPTWLWLTAAGVLALNFMG